jgi:hypothetical protein
MGFFTGVAGEVFEREVAADLADTACGRCATVTLRGGGPFAADVVGTRCGVVLWEAGRTCARLGVPAVLFGSARGTTSFGLALMTSNGRIPDTTGAPAGGGGNVMGAKLMGVDTEGRPDLRNGVCLGSGVLIEQPLA